MPEAGSDAGSDPSSGAGSASRTAHEVVGLYGDPDTTWGIFLELGLNVPTQVDAVRRGLADLVAAHPHLGPAPEPEQATEAAWDERLQHLAAAPYDGNGPLVRVLLGPGKVVVAAHHGVCDGLGLLAIAEAATGLELRSQAKGIGDRPAPVGFLRSSLSRLTEALLRPPPRFASHVVDPSPREHLEILSVPRRAVGSVDLALAVAQVFAAWNAAGSERPLLVAGASRREPGASAPDRQTAYLRFRVDPRWTREQARAAFAAVEPEPEFPETSARGIGPRVTRLLRNRLGGTAQISNLGVVESPGLEYAAMFPALSGPRALAVGLVTTSTSTSLSLRTRGSEFSAADTRELAGLIAAALTD